MALNNVQKHHINIEVPAPGATATGAPVRVGQYAGVAQTSAAAEGDPLAIDLAGSWNIEVTGEATVGAPVYLTSDGTLSTTGGSEDFWGVAAASKGSGTAKLEVAPAGILQPVSTSGSAPAPDTED